LIVILAVDGCAVSHAWIMTTKTVLILLYRIVQLNWHSMLLVNIKLYRCATFPRVFFGRSANTFGLHCLLTWAMWVIIV